MRKLLIFILFITLSKFSYSYVLTQENISQYKIHTNVPWIGRVLKFYLDQISEKEIPIIYNTYYYPSKKRGIYIKRIGHSVCSRENCVKEQSFKISSYRENIFITGATEEALLYGLYDFLEILGFKFLSREFTYIPEKFSVPLGSLEYVKNPSFEYREIFIKEADDSNFALKRKLNGRLGHRINSPLKIGNKYVYMIGLEDIFGEYNPDEPYFCDGQVDFTNPEVKIKALEYVKNFIREKNIKAAYILLSKFDNNFYCQNPYSKNRIKEGNSPSTPYLDYVKFIAVNLKDEFPGILFLAEAYLWSNKPPDRYTHFPSNMGIFFSTSEANLLKSLYEKENKKVLSNLLKWGRFTDNVLVWHYVTNFSNYLSPFLNIYTVSEDIKFLSKRPFIKGLFLQGAYNTFGSDLADLKIYLFSKLLWNPEENTQSIIDEFISLYYKGAENEIKKYLSSYKDIYKNTEMKLKSLMIPNESKVKELFFLLEEAKKKTQGNYRRHIIKAKLGLDMLILSNSDKFDKEIVKKAYRELKEFASVFGVEKYAESGNIQEILKTEPDLGSIKEPEEARGLEKGKDWFDYQELSLKLCCSDVVKDKNASNGLAVRVEGQRTDWAVQLNLGDIPEGQWDIYFVIKVESDDKQGIAFRYGVYPDTEDYEASLESFSDGKYHTVYVGRFEKDEEKDLWIAPPGEDYIKAIYVDRVFIIRAE